MESIWSLRRRAEITQECRVGKFKSVCRVRRSSRPTSRRQLSRSANFFFLTVCASGDCRKSIFDLEFPRVFFDSRKGEGTHPRKTVPEFLIGRKSRRNPKAVSSGSSVLTFPGGWALKNFTTNRQAINRTFGAVACERVGAAASVRAYLCLAKCFSTSAEFFRWRWSIELRHLPRPLWRARRGR